MLFNLEISAKLCAPVINVPMMRRFTDTVALCFVSKQSAFSFLGWNHTMIHNFPHRFSWSQVITWVVFHMVAWIQCWSLQLNAKRANSQICATCFCFDFYSSSNCEVTTRMAHMMGELCYSWLLRFFFHGKQIMSQIKIICNIRSSNNPPFQDVV